MIINTSDNTEFHIALLEKQECLLSKDIKAPFQQEEFFLKTLDEMLTELDQKKGDIEAIGIVDGPGSFSSLRIGSTVANTLGWSLSIPLVAVHGDEFINNTELYKIVLDRLSDVNNHKQFIIPAYGREPNIG